MQSITIGIDIAKKKFDVHMTDGHKLKQHKTFANDATGFAELKAIIPADAKVSVALEATGCYGNNLAHYLHNCNVQVFVLNPAQVKYYAKSMMFRTKTDKVDANIICNFLELHKNKLIAWQPKSTYLHELQSLYRYQQDLQEERIRTLGRIEACLNGGDAGNKATLVLYEAHLAYLDKAIASAEAKALATVEGDNELSRQFKLLLTIPGVGRQLAVGMLSELPDIRQFVNAKQLSAYVGLNPAIRESGSSVKGRGGISRVGSKHLRKTLYMPAMSALRFNPIIKVFGERLKERGKNGKVIVVAAMRKLLHIIYGVLKSGQPFFSEVTAT